MLIVFLILANGIYSQEKIDAITGATIIKSNHRKTKIINKLKSKDMKPNNIIFSDLSTYTPKETMAFYEDIFGWKYHNTGEDYFLAYMGNQEIVGLYETPDRFKQMRMPHFWMTYIQVNNVNETVGKARELGGIIEAEADMPGFGKVALIRDPQGAGFTIYEGGNLKNTRTENQPNTLIWNELHVSDTSKIIPFYEGIFNWKFVEKDKNHFEVCNNNQEHIADVLKVPNEYKGKYEYWVSTFGVENLKITKDKIQQKGGNIIIEEENRIMVTDDSGQAFFYIKE